jgi:hypothetical protein
MDRTANAHARAIGEQRARLAEVEWHGTEREGARLLSAIEAHCTCQPHEELCPAHSIVTSQPTLDRLVWVRRKLHEWRLGEYLVAAILFLCAPLAIVEDLCPAAVTDDDDERVLVHDDRPRPGLTFV